MQLYLSDAKILNRIKKEINECYDIQCDKYGIILIDTEKIYKLFLEHIKILLNYVLDSDIEMYVLSNQASAQILYDVIDVLHIFLKATYFDCNIRIIIEDLVCANMLSEFMCADVVDIIMEYDIT